MFEIEPSLDIVKGVCKKKRVPTILAAKGGIGYIGMMMSVHYLQNLQSPASPCEGTKQIYQVV